MGNVVYAACQWGMLVVLAKLTTPEMVGRFALGLAVTTPVIMLSNLQLRGVQATDAMDEYRFGQYLGLRLITTLLALLIIAGFALAGEYPLETALVILAIGLSKAVESISDVYFGLLQRHERMDRIAKSRIIKGILSLIALGAMVYLTGDVLWGAVALTLSWAVVMIGYDLRNGSLTFREFELGRKNPESPSESVRPIFQPRPLLSLAWLALPLGVVMMLLSLKANVPRYFIEHHWGERELGIFAALAYLIVAGNTVIGALGQSATPRLAKYYASGEIGRYIKLLVYLLTAGLTLGCGGIVFSMVGGHHLLTFLYGPEYAEQTTLFVWLMVAGTIAYLASFLGYGMTAARYFRAQLPLFALVTGTATLASLLWIPTQGPKGAALALAAGSLIQIFGSSLVIFHALRNRPAKIA